MAATARAWKFAALRLDGHSGFLRIGIRHARHRAFFALARFADVDATLEESSIFNADALRDHIPSQGPFTADIDPVAGIDVAAYLAQNHNFTGRDVRRHLAIAAYGNPIARQVDRAFDL